MSLNWIEPSGNEPRRLNEEWYLAMESDYKTQKDHGSQLNTENWLEMLSDLWKELPIQSRYLSGALGIAALTGQYSRAYTNTDIAMLAQLPILEAHEDILSCSR